MPKTKSGKSATPNKLGKVGKKSGVELSESQLAHASGGLIKKTSFDGHK